MFPVHAARHCALSKLEFTRLELSTSGIVDRSDGVTLFTGIVLRPRSTVAPGTDRECALRVLEKSEQACLVSASLSTAITPEPEIVEATQTVATTSV